MEYEQIFMRAAVTPDPRVRAMLYSVMDSADFKIDSKIAQFLTDARAFSDHTGAVFSADTAGKYASIVAVLEPLTDSAAPLWAARQLWKKTKEDTFSNVLLRAMEILKVSGGSSALEESLDYILTNLPTGLYREDEQDPDLAAEYHARADRDLSKNLSIPTGFAVVDELTTGQEPGELWVVGAYTAQGKSFFLQNVAYHRRMLGLTGVYWTTEQQVAQIKRRLVVRHSLNPKFAYPDGLAYIDIKKGRLSARERDLYLNEVLPDWACPELPPLIIKVAPSGSTLASIMQRSEEINHRTRLDFVVIDYLSQLVPAGSRRANERESQTHLFIEAKAHALNFDGKRGIPLLTAAQTNPTSFLQALDTGKYPIRAVADTAEAERSADLLMWLLRRPQDREARELQAGVAKYRDGESDVLFVLEEKFDRSFLGDRTAVDSEQSVWSAQ